MMGAMRNIASLRAEPSVRAKKEVGVETPPKAERRPDIVMVKADHNRLRGQLARHWPILHWQAVEFLVSELERATVVASPDVPPATVTMHSVVAYREGEDGPARVAQLVYPGEEQLNDAGLSVLTPAGAALIGLSEGQSISYLADDGTAKTIAVLKVLYQPEAHRRPVPADPSPAVPRLSDHRRGNE